MATTLPDGSYDSVDVGAMDLEARDMHAALQERMFGVTHEPIRLGRFVVLERLGAGGMGVVYAAYDPTLDRKIAVKLVHRDLRDSLGERLLLNEAQALARLAHPNVVTVHDVGSIDDQIFIAMEFIDGEPLSRWDTAAQGRAATLAAYLEAGEGLAAAHRAGVVHGDFKPDNVLVARDGRVRVVDFGLARRSSTVTAPETSDDGTSPRVPRVAGTPRYMAPEQILGGAADARSDQFSFCVALCEALHGEHPFGGGPWLQLSAAVTAGELRSAMQHPDVPGHVSRALGRGLRASPDERFGDMDELLDALRPHATTPWRRVAGLGVLIVVAGGIGYVVADRADAPPPCTSGAARLAGVWDDEVRTELVAAFEQTTMRYASHMAREVSTVLDAHARSWARVHRDVCLASLVEHEQPIAELDTRMRCLDRRLSELEGLTEVLRVADAQTVTKALEAVRALDSPRDCETVTEHAQAPALTEQQRALAGRLDEARGRARALQATGQLDRAAELTDEALALARELGDEHEVADLHYLAGSRSMARDDATAAVPVLLEALVGAEHSGDDDLRGQALGQMAMALTSLERFDDALRYGQLARAAMQRAGSSAERRLELELALGYVYSRSGAFEDATRVLTEALEHAMASDGDRVDDLVLALAYNNLGLVQRDRGDDEAALASLRRALEIRTTRYGPTHPNVATTRFNLATVLMQSGRWEQALEHLRATLAVYEDHGDHDSLDVAYTARGIGVCAFELGRDDEALAQFDRAARIFERVGEAARADLAFLLVERAQLLRRRGHAEQALALDQRAAVIFEERSGPQHVDLSFALVGLGEDLLALGRAGEALGPYARALELREGRGMMVEAVAEARFGVARCLADTDPARSRVLAQRAAEEFGEASSTRAREARELAERLPPAG